MVVCESSRMHQCPAYSCVHHTAVVAQEPAPSSLQTTSAAQNTVQRNGTTVGSIAAGIKITSSTHEVPLTHISIKYCIPVKPSNTYLLQREGAPSSPQELCNTVYIVSLGLVRIPFLSVMKDIRHAEVLM